MTDMPNFDDLTETGVTMLSAMRTIHEQQDEIEQLKQRIHHLNEALLNANADRDHLRSLNRSLEADCHYLRGDHL